MKYEVKYRVGDGDMYSIGWQNREVFMILPKERSKHLGKVAEWRKKYKSCRELHVPTRLAKLYGKVPDWRKK